MGRRTIYGQYCPLSMAAEILCSRWTFLLLRELLEGSAGFNEIGRGVPLISRTLLAQRLKELETAGVISRNGRKVGKSAEYCLTPAGQALGDVVNAMAHWGQEWIDAEPSLEDVDTDFLMWDIRRRVIALPEMSPRFVVRFHFPDAPLRKREHWLLFEKSEVDLCYIDPGFEIDVDIETGLKTMTKIWMGWLDLSAAISDGQITIVGPSKYTANVKTWLGLSKLSEISKRPQENRVLRKTA